MKKLFFIASLFALFINNTNAQGSDKLSLGLKIGTNYSNVYDSQGETFQADAKFGFVAGGFLQIPIGELFGVQPEVLFSQKGFKSTGSILGANYSLTRTTNYIDVPLMFVVKPAGFISILGGPMYSYLLKQRDVFDGGTITADQQKEFDNDNIRKNTFGFTGGLDINVQNVVIGARLNWDVKNNNGDGTSTTPRYKNRWVQVSLGLRF